MYTEIRHNAAGIANTSIIFLYEQRRKGRQLREQAEWTLVSVGEMTTCLQVDHIQAHLVVDNLLHLHGLGHLSGLVVSVVPVLVRARPSAGSATVLLHDGHLVAVLLGHPVGGQVLAHEGNLGADDVVEDFRGDLVHQAQRSVLGATVVVHVLSGSLASLLIGLAQPVHVALALVVLEASHFRSVVEDSLEAEEVVRLVAGEVDHLLAALHAPVLLADKVAVLHATAVVFPVVTDVLDGDGDGDEENDGDDAGDDADAALLASLLAAASLAGHSGTCLHGHGGVGGRGWQRGKLGGQLLCPMLHIQLFHCRLLLQINLRRRHDSSSSSPQEYQSQRNKSRKEWSQLYLCQRKSTRPLASL